MTPFMFYLQIRRVELKLEIELDKNLKFDIKEITKIVSSEWRDLENSKKKHFQISIEKQKEIRDAGKMNDLDTLREAVLENV